MRFHQFNSSSVTIPIEKLQDLVNFALSNKELLNVKELTSLTYIDTYLKNIASIVNEPRDLFGNKINKP